MNKANQKLRKYAKSHHVTFWQIADALGISEATMTRKMRIELSTAERTEIENTIDSIAKKSRNEVVKG